MTKTQVVKWGNSLAVRIPKGLAEQTRMKEGDAIIIKAARGHIELHRAEQIPTLQDLVAQISPANRYPESVWGSDKGREKVEW